MSKEYLEILSKADPQIQELANRTRSLVHEIMPDVTEVVWTKQNIINFGVGPKKMSEHFCYIGIFKAHINLGFYYGADLQDPHHLLEGTGKLMRHIKITSTQQIDDPSLQALVQSASEYLPKLK